MITCSWATEYGPDMPAVDMERVKRLITYVGLPDWLSPDDAEYDLALAAYRWGWEAAQNSHEYWAEPRR